MSTAKKNIIANYLGQGWNALMGLAFVPLYIKYLGMESYGLIGIFALLQAWLTLLDMGMTPTLGREMARFTGGVYDVKSIRDLLRSIEIIGFGIAVVIALCIWGVSGWLASNWLQVEKLPVGVVAQAFTIMGVVTALRFIENIYRSSIMGLQRQVLLNIVLSVTGTVRGLGAVGILIWVSPTIEAFFMWQGFLSIITAGIFAAIVYRTLPVADHGASFSLKALKNVQQFAMGMMMITFLAILLTQIDKVLLSRLLTLEAFGYYALAAAVANALYMLPGPVTAALYPRFAELLARADEPALITAYHKGAQLVSVFMGSAAIVLIVFGDIVMMLWTANPELSRQVAPLIAVLALGTLLNGLMWIPYQMQLAYGWTSLTVKINIIAVAVIVPAIFWVTPKYGAIGAAWVWVGLNTGYLTIAIYFIHRRLLPSEKWRWYIQDVAMPALGAIVVAIIARFFIPQELSGFIMFSTLLFVLALSSLASALVAPLVRRELLKRFALM